MAHITISTDKLWFGRIHASEALEGRRDFQMCCRRTWSSGEPYSTLLVSPVNDPICMVVPHRITYITPLRSLDYGSGLGGYGVQGP